MVGNNEGARAGSSQRINSLRRKRTARVCSGQIEALLALLKARPHLVTRKYVGIQGRETFEYGWKKIATELNQYPNGSVKTPGQWMTVWRDFKSRACIKAAKWRKEKVPTSNKTISCAPLTAVERRIISLIGVENSFGTECPDPSPEEATIQLQIEDVTTAEPMSVPKSMCDDEVIKTEREPASPVQQMATTSSSVASVSPPPAEEEVLDVTFEWPTTQRLISDSGVASATAGATLPSAIQQERPRRYKNVSPRRSVAGLIKMLTATTQLQAEAAKLQAEAAKAQAAASLSLAQAANKIGEALLIYANKNNNNNL